MKKGLLAIVLGSLVALGASAAQKATKRTCTLTNKTVEQCCCVQQKEALLHAGEEDG